MPYNRPCGVAGAEGWPAKIKVIPGVPDWWLGLKECWDGWRCIKLMGDEVVVVHLQWAALKPLVLVADDYGHSFLCVVNSGHQGVGLGGYDGVGAQWLAGLWVCPIGKETGEGE